MARNYYITQPGRLRRKDNTLYLEPENAPRIPIPVEDIDALYFYGELDLNTKLLNFLAQKHIAFHVFNYYGYYSGSYYPREYLNSGSLLVKQVQHYEKRTKRMVLAHEFVESAVFNMLRILRYHTNRGKDCNPQIELIEKVLTESRAAKNRLFIAAFDEQLKQTVSHRRLKRHVSYQRLIRLECYKLIKHLVGMENYQALRPWW